MIDLIAQGMRKFFFTFYLNSCFKGKMLDPRILTIVPPNPFIFF